MMHFVADVIVTLLVLLLSLCAAQDNSQANTGSNFGFDCRRIAASDACGTGKCTLETGQCDCPGTVGVDYRCNNVTHDTDCSSTCGNGYCNKRKCLCAESFYGDDCSVDRVLVACNTSQMLININPFDVFDGLIFVQGFRECIFEKKNITDINSSFKSQIPPGMSGWSIVLPSKSAGCEKVSINSTENGLSVNISIQYSQLFKSSVDQIVTTKCSFSNNATVSSNITTVSNSDKDLDHLTGNGKVDIVTMKMTEDDGSDLKDPVTLGHPFDVRLFMALSPNSAHTDFFIMECSANNTLTNNDAKNITFLKNGCPEQKAKSLFANMMVKTTSKTMISIAIKLKAFLFVGLSQKVTFSCVVGFCSNNTDACKEKTCPQFSSPTPAPNSNTQPSGTNNGTSGRRKRDVNQESQVTATINVRDPNDNTTTSEPVVGPTEKPDVCINNPDIIAVIAILGVSVFLLLITTIMLIFCLKGSRQKPNPGHLGNSPRPVETMRFPRLEMYSAHNDGC